MGLGQHRIRPDSEAVHSKFLANNDKGHGSLDGKQYCNHLINNRLMSVINLIPFYPYCNSLRVTF